MVNREYRNIPEPSVSQSGPISVFDSLDFLWKGFELGQLWVAIVATTIGVVLGVMFSLRRERIKQKVSHRNQIVNAMIEVLANQREFVKWHEGISSGEMQKVLNTSSANILKRNSPPEPLTTQKVLSEYPISPSMNVQEIFKAYLTQGNIRRIHNQIDNLDSDTEQDKVLIIIGTVIQEYMHLAWHLRNMYIGNSTPFDQTKWNEAMESFKNSGIAETFFKE